MKPLVSILIPAYNSESWIAQTIRSALAQTWRNKEIIIVDDGSKDRTLAMARQFAAKQVSVVTQSNQGAAAARNKAYSLAQGDYIQWLDADDLLSEDKLARQMQMVEQCQNKRALFSSEWGSFICRPGKAKFIPTLLWHDLSPLEWLLRKWDHNLHMQTATWLVSRELSAAAGPWDTRLLGDDDGEYFFRVIRRSEEVRFVAGAKVFYRISGVNRLSYIGASDRKIEAQFLGMKMQIDYLRQMNDDRRARAVCVKYLQNWSQSFYPNRMDIFEQAKQLAGSLGGILEPPSLPWKYRWIQMALGWSAAKRVQIAYNQWKSSLLHSWDQWHYRREAGILNESAAENSPTLPRQRFP